MSIFAAVWKGLEYYGLSSFVLMVTPTFLILGVGIAVLNRQSR